ncbi:MAG: hypothetical protein NT096_07765 [Proteobacteria bacterium]|nr:hypothetical protein [Pseudomonadota bacterium]
MKKKRIDTIVVLIMFSLFLLTGGFFTTVRAEERGQEEMTVAQGEEQGAVTQAEKAEGSQGESLLMQREDVGEKAGINLFNGKVRLQTTLANVTQIRTHYCSHTNTVGWLGLQSAPYDDNKFHDTKLGLFKTILSMEALVRWWESPNLVVNQEIYFKYFYEAAPDIDHKLGSNIASYDRYTDYQTPRFHWDDMMNELYFDIYSGPCNFRVGKQIVFWSETEMVQTVDKINPLDLRYGAMGIEPWDEVKLGLWMFRGFYNSSLPGNLIFEHIFIPGNPQYSRTPVEGTSWGGPAVPNSDLGPGGMKQFLDDWWEADRPKNFNFSWYQYAFRVRGNSTFNFLGELTHDWTVSLFNGFTHVPVVVRDFKEVNFTLGSLAANRSTGRGATSENLMGFFPDSFGVSAEDADEIPGRQWEPRRYITVGASDQTYEPVTGAVYRLELAYEIARPYNSIPGKALCEKWGIGSNLSMSDRQMYVGPVIHRDSFNFGLTIIRPVLWPWLQQQRWGPWSSNAVFDMTLGFYRGMIIGTQDMVDRIKHNYAQAQKYENNFTFMNQIKLIGPMDIYFIFRALYNERNWGYVVPAFSCIATTHLSVDIGYSWFYAKNPKADANGTAFAEDQDFAFIKMKYQF